jgi:putative ATPase
VGVYEGFKAAMKSARATGSLPPPKHILNAPTKLMKEIGYGDGYAYDPSTETGFSGQNYFPDGMAREVFYTPKGEGREAAIKARLEAWSKMRDGA